MRSRPDASRWRGVVLLLSVALCCSGRGAARAEQAVPGGYAVGTGRGVWRRVEDLPGWRYLHTATRLTDGRVVVVGGQVGPTPDDWHATALFDPATGRWSPGGRLAASRIRHTAEALPDGRAWVVGGFGEARQERFGQTELLDPATGRWHAGPTLVEPRSHHVSAWLPDGRLLVAGGLAIDLTAIATAEVCRPEGPCTPVAPLSVPRYWHTATALADGRALVVGGLVERDGLALASTELFDPATLSWSAGAALDVPAVLPTLTRLNDGRVLLIGDRRDGNAARFARLYDPAADTWTPAADLAESGNHTATLLPDGRVMVSGGGTPVSSAVSAMVRLYDPLTDTWTAAGEMHTPRSRHTATLLADGRVLVAGGEPDLATAEVFTPPPRLWAPLYLPSAGMPETGRPIALTDSPRHDWQPTLSPDGRTLVYVSDDPSSLTSQLHRVDLVRHGDELLPRAGLAVDVPTFLDDDTVGLGAIFGRDLPWLAIRYDLAGGPGDSRLLCNLDARRPAFRADGLQIVFDAEVTGNRDLYRWDAATDACIRLTTAAAPDVGPALGPDGRWLVFRSERDGNSEIYRMAIDGSQVQRLTRDAAYDGYATVSPDGRRVLFQSQRGGQDGIYVMNVDGSEVRTVLADQARYVTPRFTPDGCGVVYARGVASPEEERWQVFLWPRALCVAPGRSPDGRPEWSGDGRQIVFERGVRPASATESSLYQVRVVPAAGGPDSLLLDGVGGWAYRPNRAAERSGRRD